jgi:hypothetical protein
MTRARLILPLLLALGWGVSSSAQDASPSVPASDEENEDRYYDPDLESLDLRGAVLDDGSAAVVGVDEDTAIASIQLTRSRRRHKLAATVSTPLNKETGQATFVGSDGQTDVTKLKLEHTYIRWPEFELFNLYERAAPGSFAGRDRLESLIDEEFRHCLALGESLRRARAEALAAGTWNARFEPLHQKVVDLPTVEEVAKYLDVTASPLTPAEEKLLGEQAWFKRSQKFVRELGDGTGPCPELMALADPLPPFGSIPRGELLARRQAWFFGTNVTLGRKDFTFLDRTLLDSTGEVKTASDVELPWAVGARVGLIFLTESIEDRPESALILSVSRERGYEAADPLTFCEEAEDVAPLESCKTFAGAPPGDEDATLVGLEYRVAGRRVSWSPRLYYRIHDSDAKSEDELGVELPIYFLTNKDGGFQGGVVLGWSDQDDDGSIAVFVGRSFSVF